MRSARGTFDQATEIVRNGFITPHQLTPLPGKISGCVHCADAFKVALSERFGGFLEDHVQAETLTILMFRHQPGCLTGEAFGSDSLNAEICAEQVIDFAKKPGVVSDFLRF